MTFNLNELATFRKVQGMELVSVDRVDEVGDEWDHSVILNLLHPDLSLSSFMLTQEQAEGLFDLLGEYVNGEGYGRQVDP